jgi:predicted Zn-dependent peptidase
MADLDAADLATFQAFHTTYYAPDNAVLSVVGDAGVQEVFDLAKKYFGAVPPRGDIPAAPDGSTPAPLGGPVRETVVADVPAPRIYLAARSDPFGTPAYDAATVLAVALGNGRGSRLYQRLADGARLAQPDYVSAYGVDLAHAPAPLILTVTARPGVSGQALEAGLIEAVEEVARDGLAAAEIERAKALLTTSWWRQVGTVAGRADILSRYATQFDDPTRAGERLPGWLSVTPEQVAGVAARVLAATERVVLTYLPATGGAAANSADGSTKETVA